jgi:hypothetical protein
MIQLFDASVETRTLLMDAMAAAESSSWRPLERRSTDAQPAPRDRPGRETYLVKRKAEAQAGRRADGRRSKGGTMVRYASGDAVRPEEVAMTYLFRRFRGFTP